MLKVKKKDNINHELETLLQKFLDYREEITDARLRSIELLNDDTLYAIELVYEDGDYTLIPVEDLQK